ncbi:PAS domain-containing sensor histidine kinase [Parvibaculum sp.]|uniref:sensor histidine kinase n=1 Tax=Parvibaculum sp. TaxID=2024848 RepID=UPI0025E82178|nr:PAS domain-containing sensor histidine kinase [Parvibaculum sp.]
MTIGATMKRMIRPTAAAGVTRDPVLFRWTGEFADAALEEKFLRANLNDLRARVRATLYGCYVFVIWGAFDLVTHGPTQLFFLVMTGRLAALLLLVAALKLFRKPGQLNGLFLALTLSQFLVATIAPFSLWWDSTDYSTGIMSIVVVLFAFYVGVPTKLSRNLAASLVLTSGAILVAPALGNYDPATLLQNVLLLIAANAIGVQIVRASNRLRREAYLTMHQQDELNEQLTHEIDVRREAEQAMRASEESFESLFFNAPQPLALVDPRSLEVIQANSAAQVLVGYERDGDGDSKLNVSSFFPNGDVVPSLRMVAESGGRGAGKEVELIRLDGTRIWVAVSVAPVGFKGRRSVLVGLQDVTEKRHQLDTLRQARDMANEASRSKSEFLANMSHELRTPLNAIIGFSEALQNELFGPVGSPRYREYAEDIHDSGVHLLTLINDILDLSKIEAGHFKLHEDEADLNPIVSSALRLVRHRAEKADITLNCVLPDPPLTVVVDERALKQVLINLIANAVKFSHAGSSVTVSAGLRSDSLRISVADRGIGMEADDIPRALAPFSQLDGTLSRSHEGTGLGLPLAKHLTELHGGTLSIESAPDVGTTVHVDLPIECVAHRLDRDTA